jgi:hypothetical protein
MSDTERTPRAPDLHRRTLTPFGYVACIVVPILIAAIGLAILHFGYDKEDLVKGTRLPILTSDWKPGDPADDALFKGDLMLGDDGCTYLASADGTRSAIVWPAGFEATVQHVGQADQLKVYDTDRTIVARSEESIQFGGGSVPVGDYQGKQCAPASGDVLLVQSDVQVVGAQ